MLNKTSEKKKFGLKYNLFDVIVGLVSVFLVVVLMIVNNVSFSEAKETNNKVVYVFYKTKKIEKLTTYYNEMNKVELEIILEKEEYPNLLGDIKILINKEKGICIKEVTCPNHLCEDMGWVNRIGIPVVCLPNDVYVVIEYSDNTIIDNDFMVE